MNKLSGDITQALLESAKREFLDHGFQGSSLRTICGNVHVSTGAFYTRFTCKEELFSDLVHDDAEMFLADTRKYLDEAIANPDTATIDFGNDEMLTYVVRHRDSFRLLLDCSKGTPYETFRHDLLELLYRGFQQIFEANARGKVSYETTKILVQMRFTQLYAVLYNNLSVKQVQLVGQQLSVFTRGGYYALIAEV